MCVNISISLLRLSVFILLGITIIHASATGLYWYWSLSHFDTIMHVLGGFWAFLFLSSLFLGNTIQEHKQLFTKKKWIIFMGVIIIVFGWEMIEWFFDTVVYRQNIWQPHMADSVKDVIAGLLGALGAYLFIQYKFKK